MVVSVIISFFDRTIGSWLIIVTWIAYSIWLATAGKQAQKRKKKRYNFLRENLGFEIRVLRLAAYVVQADGKKDIHELGYIQYSLSNHYRPQDVQTLMEMLTKYINEPINPEADCRVIQNEFDLVSKVQLMHMLAGIVTADGFLSISEMTALNRVAGLLAIPTRTVDSILAMFRFTKEQEKKSYSYRREVSKHLSLNRAYQILELRTDATDKEVKRAYRRLAKIHHPDRVLHLNNEQQLAAKKKFQKIQEAYELIKEKRGFS